jgi:hypothetical protein
MLLGGLSKGLCGLFLELGLLAERQQMLGEMLDACSMIYPGVMQVIDRMLPTYTEHAGRRATEMQELEATCQSAELEPCVIDAIRRLHEGLAGALAAQPERGDPTPSSQIDSFIRFLAERGLLMPAASAV